MVLASSPCPTNSVKALEGDHCTGECILSNFCTHQADDICQAVSSQSISRGCFLRGHWGKTLQTIKEKIIHMLLGEWYGMVWYSRV